MRYFGNLCEREDLLQEGALAILEVLQEEYPQPVDRDRAVRQAIWRRLRWLHRNETAYRNREFQVAEEDDESRIEQVAAIEDETGSVIHRVWFDWLISHLSGKEYECIKLYFGDGLTQAEIAERLGMRQQTVSRAVRFGTSKLRKLCATGERSRG